MWTYEDIKKKYDEHRPKIVLGVCFALVFLMGFSTGRFVPKKSKTQSAEQINYSTKTTSKPTEPNAKEGETGVVAGIVATTTTASKATTTDCKVKGNISSSSKIYHVKGGAFYDRTTPEQCFDTPAEAEAAGFRKSSR